MIHALQLPSSSSEVQATNRIDRSHLKIEELHPKLTTSANFDGHVVLDAKAIGLESQLFSNIHKGFLNVVVNVAAYQLRRKGGSLNVHYAGMGFQSLNKPLHGWNCH